MATLVSIKENRLNQITSQTVDNRLLNPLTDVIIESWRFSKLFSRLLTQLDAGKNARYLNQQRYFLKKLEESLNVAGLRLINLEGTEYDPGIAATALNLEDFDTEDHLVVEQMLEPVIMSETGVIRTGTVMLKKVNT